ncbi:hypothetical protein [Yokenella regensburgei]|uniref:hypothetical protein n=1 Tax=Yokenella regensburgei TaxID=158877 RepID=UPI002898F0BA|nr:hypothetical protein [Yokenella regensburgei]
MDNYNTLNNIIHLYRNQKVSKETFIGAIVCLLLDKQTFKSNNEVGEFINLILNIQIPTYMVRSRTLMVARVCRIINGLDTKNIEKLSNTTYRFLKTIMLHELNQKSKVAGTGRDSLSNLDKWITGILKKDN